jgi:hypothetical protein
MQQPVNMEDRPSRTAQYYGLLAAPGGLGVMAATAYALAPAACRLGWLQFQVMGTSGLALLTFLIAVAAILVGVSGGIVAFRNRQQAIRAGAGAEERSNFLGVGGIMMSVLFVGLSMIVGLSLLSFRPC